MLKSIRNLEKKKREGLLAGLALQLSGPGLPDQEQHAWGDEYDRIYNEVLAEIGEELRVDPSDPSPRTQRLIYEYLNRTLRALTFDSSKVAESRNRLGYQGILPSKLYDIVLLESFRRSCEPMGISAAEVERCILNARAVEHYLPEKFGQQEGNAVSLFIADAATSDPSTVVVEGFRNGAKISVEYAFRLFHSDFAIVRKPVRILDVVQAFATRYGLDITAGGKTSKFFFYTSWPKQPGDTQNNIISYNAESRNHATIDARFAFRQTATTWEVAMAYAIDVTEYARDLLKHHVRVTRKDVIANLERRGLLG